MSLPSFIALLRGINVGGRARIPMPELRSLCLEHGWADVQTYIQSGNLLLRAQAEPARLEEDLERAIERRFGFAVPVLVRSAGEWPAYVRGNPFQEESRSEPNLVMLALSKEPPKADAAGRLQERAAGGERVAQVGDALWIHFASGSARSKLTPALLDRLAGSAVTTRNWRTVLKLEELVRELGP